MSESTKKPANRREEQKKNRKRLTSSGVKAGRVHVPYNVSLQSLGEGVVLIEENHSKSSISKAKIHHSIYRMMDFSWIWCDFSQRRREMNTTLTLLYFNILEAALSLTHQLTHHFFDCNSLSKIRILRLCHTPKPQFFNHRIELKPVIGQWQNWLSIVIQKIGSHDLQPTSIFYFSYHTPLYNILYVMSFSFIEILETPLHTKIGLFQNL